MAEGQGHDHQEGRWDGAGGGKGGRGGRDQEGRASVAYGDGGPGFVFARLRLLRGGRGVVASSIGQSKLRTASNSPLCFSMTCAGQEAARPFGAISCSLCRNSAAKPAGTYPTFLPAISTRTAFVSCALLSSKTNRA